MSRPWRAPILGAGATLALFWAAGALFFDGFQLDLGSIVWPTPGYARFLGLWAAFGAIAAALLALGISQWLDAAPRAKLLSHLSSTASDAAWMSIGALSAACIALVVRGVVLDGARLTDDEAAYRFMAELLANGRLRATSPPLKLFFDQVFFVNDGHLYAQYFLGWPALLVPGVWLAATGAMNALYSAATVPALYLVLRRLAGSAWAKLGLVFYLASPMLMIGAATELAHTSCTAALAWMTWFLLRARDRDAPRWSDAGMALAFGIAFFVRPSAALAIGAPFLVGWAAAIVRAPRPLPRALAFAIPALALASLFLIVNRAQTGSFLTVGYQRYDAYMKENGYRFSFDREPGEPARGYASLVTSDPAEIAASFGAALVRLNFDLFGWPSSLLFALAAGAAGSARLLWASLVLFFLLHVTYNDVGIDSFGPVHYFETAWPILLLSVLGVKRLAERGLAPDGIRPVALAVALVAVAAAGFTPVRLAALASMARDINAPTDAAARAHLGRAVVFAPQPFAPSCHGAPNEHFVHWRPPNDPELRNSVLWANHISPDADRLLMAHFPDRTAYVMAWRPSCRVEILPLDGLAPGDVPDGYIGGTGVAPAKAADGPPSRS